MVMLANLIQLMASKTEEPISQVSGCIIGWIEIVVTGSYSCMIRGSHIPSTLQERELNWESGSGVGLTQEIKHENSFTYTCTNSFVSHITFHLLILQHRCSTWRMYIIILHRLVRIKMYYFSINSWQFGIKIKETWRKGSTKEATLIFKSVGIIYYTHMYIYIVCSTWSQF